MTATPPRNAFIDHLRVAATTLVILHHVAIAYGGSGGWYWRQEADGSNRLLILFNAVNQSWFMGFFFLLAGYYTPRSYARKGGRAYLGDRLLRLGVPLFGYALILSPMTIALARTSRGHPFWAGWWQMLRLRQGEPGPLWFAEALLLFALAYVLWRKVRPGGARDLAALPTHATLLAIALAIGAVSYAVRFAVPVGRNIAWMQLGYFPPYILLFAFGCLAARHQLLETVEFRTARPWLLVSAVMFVLLPVVMVTHGDGGSFSGGWNLNAVFYAFWDPLMAWGIILALLWWFRTRLSGTNRLGEFLARRAFGAYIVHPPVVVGLGLLARSWPIAPFAKFLAVGALATAGAFGAAALLLLVPGAKRIL